MKIITWTKYKKDNGIKQHTNIISLRESGFTQMPLVFKRADNDTPPKEMVAEAVKGQDFSLVVYHSNITPFQKGYSISVFAK